MGIKSALLTGAVAASLLDAQQPPKKAPQKNIPTIEMTESPRPVEEGLEKNLKILEDAIGLEGKARFSVTTEKGKPGGFTFVRSELGRGIRATNLSNVIATCPNTFGENGVLTITSSDKEIDKRTTGVEVHRVTGAAMMGTGSAVRYRTPEQLKQAGAHIRRLLDEGTAACNVR